MATMTRLPPLVLPLIALALVTSTVGAVPDPFSAKECSASELTSVTMASCTFACDAGDMLHMQVVGFFVSAAIECGETGTAVMCVGLCEASSGTATKTSGTGYCSAAGATLLRCWAETPEA